MAGIKSSIVGIPKKARIAFLRLMYGGRFEVDGPIKYRRRLVLNLSTSDSILRMGGGCFFNNDCSINVRQSVSIGCNCLFGEGVRIYDHDHCFAEAGKPIREQGFKCKPVSIGDDCWFGSNVVILKGVTVGDGCVIGAGTVVTKDVPPGSIVFAHQDLVVKDRF